MENIIINIFICFIGLLGLFYGGEKLVAGSVSVASIFKVKPQFIAISIIALQDKKVRIKLETYRVRQTKSVNKRPR